MNTFWTRADFQRKVVRSLAHSSSSKVSVYLHASPPADVQRQQVAGRWQGLRQQLAELGAEKSDLALIDDAVSNFACGDRMLAVLVSDGQVWLSAELDHSDEPDRAVIGQWPRIVPLIRWGQRQLPAVVALVGHGDAEVSVYNAGTRVSTEIVPGPDDEIERNAPGGWSQGRYRRRAEDSWAHNAVTFAQRIAQIAQATDAKLIVLSGDVREVHLVLDRLPADLREIVSTVPGPKSDDHRTAQIAARDLRSLSEETARKWRRAVVAGFDDSSGRSLAVEGPVAVQQALERGAVRQLLIVDGVPSDQSVDAMACVALDTDAEIVVLEPDEITLVGGIGASLRF